MSKTIAICAGHGGSDSGARGIGGVLEKDLNLRVTLRLRDLLQAAGHKVIMARTTDVNAQEARFAQNIIGKCDISVAVHFNAWTDNTAHGHEIGHNRLHNIHESQRLCRFMKAQVLKRHQGLRDRGGKAYNFAMSNTRTVNAYCEGLFITGTRDQPFFNPESQLMVFAEAYFAGIQEYFGLPVTLPANPVPTPARTIGDALEILKKLAGLPNTAPSNSSMGDVLDILKELAGIGSGTNPASVALKDGDIVEIIGEYASSATATTAPNTKGKGLTRRILRTHIGTNFPFQVGDNTGTLGFFKATSLRKV
jgi:N-acetylmuramoyl-L-alanine amidase